MSSCFRSTSPLARTALIRSREYDMRMLIRLTLFAAALTAMTANPCAAAPLRVVATTEDLASLAREVGGDKVTVVALAKGYQDPHFVDPKPSFILEVSRADLLIVVGRELEIGWLPPLDHEQPQREDPAGRERLSRCLGQREDPRDSDGADYAGHGRRAPAGQSPLLARPSQRPAHRAGDQGQARASSLLPTRVLRRRDTPISTSGWPRPRAAGTR